MASLTYDDILERKVAFGTPAGVLEKIGRLSQELGVDGIVAEPNPGGLIPPALEARSLELLAREVAPALR
jgi:alkanesulfonate monooxygenase SsuD/methylene tetrahydromethanopterin reductase-like flavin-dependent oxidoreductase (luciferase family)